LISTLYQSSPWKDSLKLWLQLCCILISGIDQVAAVDDRFTLNRHKNILNNKQCLVKVMLKEEKVAKTICFKAILNHLLPAYFTSALQRVQ